MPDNPQLVEKHELEMAVKAEEAPKMEVELAWQNNRLEFLAHWMMLNPEETVDEAAWQAFKKEAQEYGISGRIEHDTLVIFPASTGHQGAG